MEVELGRENLKPVYRGKPFTILARIPVHHISNIDNCDRNSRVEYQFDERAHGDMQRKAIDSAALA
jgi:hypothetical protein